MVSKVHAATNLQVTSSTRLGSETLMPIPTHCDFLTMLVGAGAVSETKKRSSAGQGGVWWGIYLDTFRSPILGAVTNLTKHNANISNASDGKHNHQTLRRTPCRRAVVGNVPWRFRRRCRTTYRVKAPQNATKVRCWSNDAPHSCSAPSRPPLLVRLIRCF